MAPPVSLQEECLSLWHGYAFRSRSKEAQFWGQWQTHLVHACQLWCCCHLVIDGLFPLSQLGEVADVGFEFYKMFGPSLTLALTTLFMSFVPWCRRHILIVISVAVALMMFMAAVLVHRHTRLWNNHAMQKDLCFVVEGIADNAKAMAQLQAFLLERTSFSNLWRALCLRMLPGALLICFVGFHPYTLVVSLFAAVATFIILTLSPHIPLQVSLAGEVRCGAVQCGEVRGGKGRGGEGRGGGGGGRGGEVG